MNNLLLPCLVCLCVNIVVSDNVNQQPAADEPGRPGSLVMFQVLPKILSVVRGELSARNLEIPFPVLFKEIQSTMFATQLTDFTPQGIQAWANQLIQHIVDQINTWSSQHQTSTEEAPSVVQGEFSPRPHLADKESEEVNTAEDAVADRIPYPLPDLAFDRDPSRMQDTSKLEKNDVDDELGFDSKPNSEQEANEVSDNELYLSDDKKVKAKNS